MINQEDNSRTYSYETVCALVHHRDVQIARLSADLAAFKVAHERLSQIAHSIIQLDRNTDSVDIVSEGIRPIADDAQAALAQNREVSRLIAETQAR